MLITVMFFKKNHSDLIKSFIIGKDIVILYYIYIIIGILIINWRIIKKYS
jgi:hypothetical protein